MNSSIGKPNIKKDAFQKDSLRTDFNKQLQQELRRLQSIINNTGKNSIVSTTDTMLVAGDTTIYCQNPITITLPDIIGVNTIVINNNSIGEIIINADPSDTIREEQQLVLLFKNSTVVLRSSEITNNWTVI